LQDSCESQKEVSSIQKQNGSCVHKFIRFSRQKTLPSTVLNHEKM